MPAQIYDFLDFFEDQHDYFRAIIDHSEIHYTTGISTAAVAVENKKIVFKINEEWWEKETPLFTDKCFVIAHEMSHLLFRHLKKIQSVAPRYRLLMNVAMDLFINQLMCRFFGISRRSLSPALSQEGCWLDTVFPHREDVEIDRGTDYYYNELLAEARKADASYEGRLLKKVFSILQGDCEASLSDEEFDRLQEVLHSASEHLDFDFEEALSEVEEEKVEKMLLAGRGGGGHQTAVVEDLKVKKPWESVIRKWCRSTVMQKRQRSRRWGFTNRKFDEICGSSNYLFQGDPSIVATAKDREKVSVALFLDTSESCIGLKSRFVSAAASIPEKHFDLHAATFDTSVKKLFDDQDDDSQVRNASTWKIWGGGGTAFDIIEDYLQQLPEYPDAVFIITDGFGNRIQPEHPERFSWFLTKFHSTSYIPYKSRIYKLDNFA